MFTEDPPWLGRDSLSNRLPDSDRESLGAQGYISESHFGQQACSPGFRLSFSHTLGQCLPPKFASRAPTRSANVAPRMASDSQLTPMMAQYRRIKSELPKDALLLFRLGDFYEMFFEDAQVGAQILNVALTKRGAVPMCGIPFHAANGYVSRLLKAGRKVAICEQVEEARPGQLVKREVTQILSPGTHFDERMLTAESNNFLAAIYPLQKVFGFART